MDNNIILSQSTKIVLISVTAFGVGIVFGIFLMFQNVTNMFPVQQISISDVKENVEQSTEVVGQGSKEDMFQGKPMSQTASVLLRIDDVVKDKNNALGATMYARNGERVAVNVSADDSEFAPKKVSLKLDDVTMTVTECPNYLSGAALMGRCEHTEISYSELLQGDIIFVSTTLETIENDVITPTGSAVVLRGAAKPVDFKIEKP